MFMIFMVLIKMLQQGPPLLGEFPKHEVFPVGAFLHISSTPLEESIAKQRSASLSFKCGNHLLIEAERR